MKQSTIQKAIAVMFHSLASMHSDSSALSLHLKSTTSMQVESGQDESDEYTLYTIFTDVWEVTFAGWNFELVELDYGTEAAKNESRAQAVRFLQESPDILLREMGTEDRAEDCNSLHWLVDATAENYVDAEGELKEILADTLKEYLYQAIAEANIE